MRGGELDGVRVTGVGVAKDPQSRIAGKDALETAFGIFSALGDDDHAGVLRIADTDTAAVVDRYSRCAGGRVDERVEQRPIGNRVAAIEHPFGFAIRRRH